MYVLHGTSVLLSSLKMRFTWPKNPQLPLFHTQIHVCVSERASLSFCSCSTWYRVTFSSAGWDRGAILKCAYACVSVCKCVNAFGGDSRYRRLCPHLPSGAVARVVTPPVGNKGWKWGRDVSWGVNTSYGQSEHICKYMRVYRLFPAFQFFIKNSSVLFEQQSCDGLIGVTINKA